MTERNMTKALEEAKRVVGMIEAETLTDAERRQFMTTQSRTSTKTLTQDGSSTESQYQLTLHS